MGGGNIKQLVMSMTSWGGTERVIKELSPTNNLVLSYTSKFFEAFK